MITVNIHEAKTRLSKLIERVVAGEPFIIAKAGKPLAKVVPYDAPKKPMRIGFMKGKVTVGKDVDIKSIDREEIIAMFEGGE